MNSLEWNEKGIKLKIKGIETELSWAEFNILNRAFDRVTLLRFKGEIQGYEEIEDTKEIE